MKKKVIQLIFVVAIFAVLLLSFGRTAFFPQEINDYENRKAEKLAPITWESYLNGTLQANMENAIADQAFFDQLSKKTYNSVLSAYMYKASGAVASAYPDRYIKVGDHYLYGDHLMNGQRNLSDVRDTLDARIAEHNALYARYPGADFYLYYVENDMDIQFETGVRSGVYEHIAENTSLPASHVKRFAIDDFSTFDRDFYKTDHHWNAAGSYRAYQELVSMLLSEQEPVLKPVESVVLSTEFQGSKTMSKETAAFKEPFEVYRFAFPQMQVYVNGLPATSYGNQEAYLNGAETKPVTYAAFYGEDWGTVTFDTGHNEKENLLIISESHDNAVLQLLASHFNRTISIDMRNFNAYMGMDFSIDEFIEPYGIDKVLFLGYMDYFLMEDFSLEK